MFDVLQDIANWILVYVLGELSPHGGFGGYFPFQILIGLGQAYLLALFLFGIFILYKVIKSLLQKKPISRPIKLAMLLELLLISFTVSVPIYVYGALDPGSMTGIVPNLVLFSTIVIVVLPVTTYLAVKKILTKRPNKAL